MRLSRIIQKILFYLSSFIPLYILLFIQNIQIYDKKNETLSLSDFYKQFISGGPEQYFWVFLLILFLLSLFGILLFFLVYVKTDGRKGTLNNGEFIREDTLGYIVTYIVPLISMDISSYRSLIINLMLFIIIGTFYVKNDQIFMNPLYNICGYNVLSSDENVYITKIRKSRLKIIAKRSLDVRKINIVGDIYVIKEINKKERNKDDLY